MTKIVPVVFVGGPISGQSQEVDVDAVAYVNVPVLRWGQFDQFVYEIKEVPYTGYFAMPVDKERD